ncbi:MAG: ABC transporter ATP-binding protein [Firmicutes bacterium]|nr:ABC transporter ATP-binding protein [Bacillota bacterium]
MLLECINLNKSFGKKQILKDVSFTIEEGDILAFIGPNGSGKTTTIKLILGLQSIDSGQVIINGYSIEKEFVKAIEKVGSIVENPDLYMYLSGYQNLKLISNYYENITEDKIQEVIEIVGLKKRIHDKVSKYSLGMRQRLGIARALLHNPNILILDEPTNGLDPVGIKDLRELLKKLAKQKIGVLISSHNLAELESFCNKVCVIDNGRIIDIKDVKKFKEKENTFIFNVENTKEIKINNIKIINETSFEVKTSKNEVAEIIKELVKQNINIYEVKEQVLTLEEAFLEKTRGNKND